MNQRAEAALPVPSSCPLDAIRTPRPASYHVVTSGDGRRGLPSTRWLERGVTGDDEAGASRLPLICPTSRVPGARAMCTASQTLTPYCPFENWQQNLHLPRSIVNNIAARWSGSPPPPHEPALHLQSSVMRNCCPRGVTEHKANRSGETEQTNDEQHSRHPPLASRLRGRWRFRRPVLVLE